MIFSWSRKLLFKERSLEPRRGTIAFKDPLLQSGSEAKDNFNLIAQPKRRDIFLWHCCFLIIYLLIFVLYAFRPQRQERTIPEKVSLYSPAQVAIGSYSTVKIDGTVRRNDSTWDISSKFAGQPSPALDAAWNQLSPPIPRIRLTHEEMRWAGYDIEDAVVLEHGDHSAILNVHHQLHCLNAIRRMTYIDYYTALGQHTSPDLSRVHIDHCIEMFRQIFMCYADIAPLPYIQDQLGNVRLDFDVVQQCRDYDRINKWAWGNTDYTPLPGHVL